MTEMIRDLELYVAGEWLGAQGRRIEEVINPATGETIARLPHATQADLDRALTAAGAAFDRWKDVSVYERAKILRQAAGLLRERIEALALAMTLEQGKTIGESRIELMGAADIFEELAKYRAARVIWAEQLRHRYGARNENSWKLRFHAQTAGCSLQDKQPQVNLIRVAYQALAAVLGGCQSLHTNSMDETLALPSEHAVTLALRTQQVLAYETGATNTVDPLGGSYFVEALTKQMQQQAQEYFERIEQKGGMIAALEDGFFRREIADAAFVYQRDVDAKRKLIVGVNAFQETDEKPIETLVIDAGVEKEQIASLKGIKSKRDTETVRKMLAEIRRTAGTTQNLMPILLEAARARCTVGEIVSALADVFGRYDGAAKW